MLLCAILLTLPAGQAAAQPEPMAEPGRILLPPPVEWDHAMLNFHPALQQTAYDFANLTGGIGFGMSVADVVARLPEPHLAGAWNDLRMATEFPGEVRYFSIALDRAGPLRTDAAACAGAASRVVFLFSGRGLFRLSYRLTADKLCTDPNPAAQAILSRYVPIGQHVALSLRYRTGRTEVVEVTDPTAGYLIPVRWRQGPK